MVWRIERTVKPLFPSKIRRNSKNSSGNFNIFPDDSPVPRGTNRAVRPDSMELRDTGKTPEMLAFEVGGRRYALPAAQVRELVRAVAIVSLADTAPNGEGV